MPLFFAFMVVVVALQFEGTKNAIDRNWFSSLALLSWLGMVSRIDAVSRGLKQPTHQLVGGLEKGRPHQHFQLLHRDPAGRLRLKASDQLLDFLLLGEEELGWRLRFFFELTAARCWRVCSITSWAYCSISSWN